MSQPDSPNVERAQELMEARELRTFLRTVGDTVRLQILKLLARNEEMSVTELVRALHISQPLISWHLGVLRRIELVSIRKEGRLVWYSLDRAVLQALWKRFNAWVGETSCASIEERGEEDA